MESLGCLSSRNNIILCPDSTVHSQFLNFEPLPRIFQKFVALTLRISISLYKTHFNMFLVSLESSICLLSPWSFSEFFNNILSIKYGNFYDWFQKSPTDKISPEFRYFDHTLLEILPELLLHQFFEIKLILTIKTWK